MSNVNCSAHRTPLMRKLGVILLAFEIVVLLCCAIAMFGLNPQNRAGVIMFSLGVLFVMISAFYILRFPFGGFYLLCLHISYLLTGLFHAALFVVAVIFLGLWLYCYIRARKIDAQLSKCICKNTQNSIIKI